MPGITDLTPLAGGGGAGLSPGATQQRSLTAHGEVARAPASETDSIHVVLTEMSRDDGYEVIAGHWQKRGSTLPAVGNECLVVFDDLGDAWVPVFNPF